MLLGGVEIHGVKYRALGPLAAESDGVDVKLGGLRQQTVLAVLLLHANTVVPQDRLIDYVWAGDPPEAARATVQSYIYNLRQSLGAESIGRRGDGYVIEVDSETFDVIAFEARVEAARNLLHADPSATRAYLLEGLAMWFGRAYGDVDHPELHGEIQRLGELRLNAIETRIEADLALGRAGELVGELKILVRDYPLRERFWAQLMLALYRSGRQAESLRAFHQARSSLVDQLGIEPGHELQRLEDRILGQDPSLLAQPAPRTPTDSRMIRGYEVRQVLMEDDFGVVYLAYQPSVGREVMVSTIRAEYANDLAFVGYFEREAQIVANLEHPHILPLYDYWRDAEGAYLVMPLMNGGSLDESLQSGGWNLDLALRAVDQIGSALAYAHRRGVLHHDLNPGNVLLDDDGNAYLTDFGIAARLTPTAGVSVRLHPGYIPPEESAGGPYTAQSDIFRLGALTFHLLAGVPPPEVGPLPNLVEIRPGIPPQLADAVARATAEEASYRFGRMEDYLREVRRAAGVDVVIPSGMIVASAEELRNPYKGLRAFGESDAVDFHGRVGLVDDLLQKVTDHRLVTVVGPSGSGKSSLVHAGLVPALRAGGITGSQHWLLTSMFPGSYPFEELEAALSRVAVVRQVGLQTELTEPNGLLRVAKKILPGEDSTLLIVIDQFEELFSSVRSEDVRRRFLDNLVAVAHDERSRVRIVTTIRADFLDRPLDYGDFAEAIADGTVIVGPPTREGLAQAVAAPARAVGLDLEPGLVGRVTSDVLGQAGVLPLLQHALTELFSRREGRALTIAAYEATGGVAGALGRRAEELYEGLPPAGQTAVREVFLRLVSVDEFASDTRRRARQSELLSLGVDRASVESVLSAYAGFRLLTFDRDPVTRGPTVEVAHEALLSEWPRLRGWIDDARQSLILARRVGESAREWVEARRDPSYLLRGARLEEVTEWASGPDVVLTTDESDYIDASVQIRAAERASGRRRRKRTVVSLAAGLALVSLFAVVALLQRDTATREAVQARVRELAMASVNHLDQNRELALLIAVEAFDESWRATGPMAEAVSAMAQSIQDWRLIGRFPSSEYFLPAASSDGSLFATSPDESPADINLLDSSGSLVETLTGPDHPEVVALTVSFHSGGERVAVAYVGVNRYQGQATPEGVPDVVIFDVLTGATLTQVDLEQSVFDVAFSPSGSQLAISSGRDLRIFDSMLGVEIARFEASSRVGRPHFLDDVRVLIPIEGSGFGTFSIPDGSLIDEIPVENLALVTASNGARIAFRAGDRISVMDIASRDIVSEIEGKDAIALALDPEGRHLAYAGWDPTIRVVPLNGGGRGVELPGTLENVLSLTFVDSDRLLSFGEDALMWDVSPEGPEALGGVPLSIAQWGFQVSSDGRLLTYYLSTNPDLSHPDDGVRMIDLLTGQEILAVDREVMTIVSGFRQPSPGFTLLGSMTQDGLSTVRRLPSWSVVRRFEECRSPIAFTPDDGQVLVTGWACGWEAPPGSIAESEVIDLDTGASILTIPYRTIWSAAFNPEGRFRAGRYLTATDQFAIEVWDLETGGSLGRIDAADLGNVGAIMALSFDPSGRYVVGGTTGGMVWVLDMDRVVEGDGLLDSMVLRRQAHSGAAPVPALSAAGVVATAGFDGMVRLWNLESGNLIFEFRAEGGAPVVRFTPDGSHLLYPHGDTIRRIPVDPHQLRELASRLLTRDFLPDECIRYARPERCADH